LLEHFSEHVGGRVPKHELAFFVVELEDAHLGGREKHGLRDAGRAKEAPAP
jgi:hypothetical protein